MRLAAYLFYMDLVYAALSFYILTMSFLLHNIPYTITTLRQAGTRYLLTLLHNSE